MTASPLHSIRFLALSCTALAALAAPAQAAASGAGTPAISVSPPEGFDNLAESQPLIVDVYFGQVRRGETRITASAGAIAFADPAGLLDMLPPVTDRAAVERALAAPELPTHARLACSLSSDPAACGRLEPEIAGVIFDRNRFRVDVFINPVFLEIEGALSDPYLPEPAPGLSLVNTFGAVVSGRFGAGDRFYSLHDSLTAGFGAGRLRADLSYASRFGFQAESLALEWDRPGLRYTAGAFWTPGTALAGRRRLVGAGVASQIDTRRDKDEMTGSPLVVHLSQRGRIDVLREGRVISSAVYDAGNRPIDTSGFPHGSYEVVLRIDEPGRPLREERRFFTKSQQIPSLGRTDFFAFAGLETEGLGRGSLVPSDEPYLQAGVIHRLNENWALSGGLEAGGFGASAELGADLLTGFAHFRAAAIADLEGGYGGLFQLASAGTSRLNFNFDLRHVERRETAAGALPPPGLLRPSVPLQTYAGSYSQAGGLVSYSRDNLRLLATLLYRDDEASAEHYSIGPSVEWDVLRSGPVILTLRADLAATEQGESGFAGVSLRTVGGQSSVTLLGGVRASSRPDDGLGNGAVTGLSAAWTPAFARGDLSLGAGYDRQPEQTSASFSTIYDHRLGSLSGDIVHSAAAGSSITQYAAGFQTSFAAGAGALRVAGKTTSESLIVAEIEGARAHDTFEVLVNDQVAGSTKGTAPLAIALPPYRAYNVRIRPTGRELVAYDSSVREVGLYPGSVTRLAWAASPITIKIGRLVLPDGTPAGRATITGKGVWSETDESGHFQIEAPADAVFEVTLADGRRFSMTLPEGRPENGIARLDAVTCCERDDTRLGSLGDLPLIITGASR